MADSLKNGHAGKTYLILAGAVTWLGLGLQLYLFLRWAVDHQTGVHTGLWNFFDYFTNWVNLFAGVLLLRAIAHGHDYQPSLKDSVNAMYVAVYVWVAGIVFNLELRALLPPGELVLIANVILHDVTPLLFFGFWWFYYPFSMLRLKNAYTGLVFPVCYFGYVVVRERYTGQYPYPFFDVAKHGYFSVLTQCVALLLGFLLVGFAFIAINKLKAR